MSYEIKGNIKKIMQPQVFESGFKKQQFVITTDEKFPQDVKLELTKEKTELLDPLEEGNRVDVSFNIRGNEYKGKYYVNLQAWRIKADQQSYEGLANDLAQNITLESEQEAAEEDVPF